MVIGQQEQDKGLVTVRNRDDNTHQEQISLEEVLAKFESLAMPSSKPLKKVSSVMRMVFSTLLFTLV